MKEPVISIICNTFNQEKYIAEALESFLMQKVNVSFEILVHDDASTDSTSEIIREYEAKYPDIIKPIYQSVNQYSKGVSITTQIQVPRAKGKYIAFCEGDDYWIDDRKLQIQYDFMEQNLEYAMCCHAFRMVTTTKELIKNQHFLSQNGDIPFTSLIGEQLTVPQFATLFLKKSCIADLGEGSFLGRPCSGMTYRLKCAIEGKIYYFDRVMSCYRRFVEGSWTVREGSDKNAMIRILEEEAIFYEKLDAYTNYIYSDDIKSCIDDRYFKRDLLVNDYNTARKRIAYKVAPWKKKLYINIGCILPALVNVIRNNRKK